MPENNLSINIIAKSDKARAELELLNAKIRQTRTEVRQLTDAAQRTGGGQMTPQIQATTAALQSYERQARAARTATIGVAEANVVAGRSYRELSRLTKEFGEAAGVPIRGLGAIRSGLIALGATEVLRAVKAGIDSLNELNNAAANFRISPEALRQAREGVQKIGQEAKVADDMLATMRKNEEDAIQKQRALGQGGGAGVLRGGGARVPTLADIQGTVLRGGGPPGATWDQILAQAGTGIAPFILGRPFDEKRRDQEWRTIAQIILRQRDAELRNWLSQQAFGQTFETAFGTEQAPGLQRQRAMGTLPEKTQEMTKRQQEALETANENAAAAHKAWEGLIQLLGLMAVDAATTLTQLNTIKAALSGTASTGRARELGAALPFAQPGTTAPVESGLYASGGLIRGPGTGTSDSILARVSNGEFVINAASARQLGTNFLNSLNSIPRFARGGEIMLRTGSQEIPLRGASDADWKLADENRRRYRDAPMAVVLRGSRGPKAQYWPAIDFDTGLPITVDYDKPWVQAIKGGVQFIAAGGLIRGPGTGTSDSIPAWLSNGEYVLNAASVRRLGTGFLNALNGFALGGLVSGPRVGFADGGLVSSASSSGQPVHLHLGSHSFALSGAPNIVSSLVVEAGRQQMRSAGTKPSWYGGRVSG